MRNRPGRRCGQVHLIDAQHQITRATCPTTATYVPEVMFQKYHLRASRTLLVGGYPPRRAFCGAHSRNYWPIGGRRYAD